MKKDLCRVVNTLQGDVSAISEYLANPEIFLSKYDLDEREKKAFIDKDIDALITLGIDQELATNAMSSPCAHSQRCTSRPMPKQPRP